MKKPLAISQRQITAICKGAKAAGYIADVTINGVTIRLMPAEMASPTSYAPSREDPTLEEW